MRPSRLSFASRPTPGDYAERVYAGVLGKLIGVYLGRPFENWSHERIEAQLGEIHYYVNGHPAIAPEKRHNPLVQPDDDISGTFTFLRALPDYGNAPDLTPAQIGQTWLNYLVEQRSTLWWGGLGLSTEHTAFLRLKHGIPAPQSGSAARNGTVLSEQIGAQIFIDGWALVAPGDPELAADLARRAASVSHDGEAILAAQVIAAMEAEAFVESSIDRLIDTAVSLIPPDSVTARLIDDLRAWHAAEADWRRTRARIEERYGYDRYGGNCHVIPNHALVIHALLHGDDDFERSLSIVNTSGWDTDCNSGNVGCLLGIKNGLAAIDAGPDWRGPIGDRLYLSSADGGRAITDAVAETFHVVNIGRALAGEAPVAPKDGARFSFALPGSIQGFAIGDGGDARLGNAAGALTLHMPSGTARAATATFTPPEAVPFMDEDLLAAPWLHPGKYALVASPTLYPGQTLRARVLADAGNGTATACRLVISSYDGADRLATLHGPDQAVQPGQDADLTWRVPETGGQPVAEVGIEARGEPSSILHLDSLTWDGAPECRLERPADGGTMWRRAWVPALDRFESPGGAAYQLIQNEGRGLLVQGAREWTDYEVTATVSPEAIAAGGIAARVQGLRRYYALLLGDDDTVRLVKALDGDTVLAEAPFAREYRAEHQLGVRVAGASIEARVDGRLLFSVEDSDRPLTGGAVAFVCEEGCLTSDAIAVQPLTG
jgi:ADP-ribosylglycohydrolase